MINGFFGAMVCFASKIHEPACYLNIENYRFSSFLRFDSIRNVYTQKKKHRCSLIDQKRSNRKIDASTFRLHFEEEKQKPTKKIHVAHATLNDLLIQLLLRRKY